MSAEMTARYVREIERELEQHYQELRGVNGDGYTPEAAARTVQIAAKRARDSFINRKGRETSID